MIADARYRFRAVLWVLPSVIFLVSIDDNIFSVNFPPSDDLPFWVYIIIAVGVILLVTVVVIILYSRVDRW